MQVHIVQEIPAVAQLGAEERYNNNAALWPCHKKCCRGKHVVCVADIQWHLLSFRRACSTTHSLHAKCMMHINGEQTWFKLHTIRCGLKSDTQTTCMACNARISELPHKNARCTSGLITQHCKGRVDQALAVLERKNVVA